MENITSSQPNAEEGLYARLDRFLLYLMSVELGYFILLVLATAGLTVLLLTHKLSPRLYMDPSEALWVFWLYFIALPVNLACGFAGLILNIRTRHAGYPGTGHLLNWIFLASTAWLFVLAFFIAVPSQAFGD